jgi:hypothetical protein
MFLENRPLIKAKKGHIGPAVITEGYYEGDD